jgi:serine/threonine-protein kinase
MFEFRVLGSLDLKGPNGETLLSVLAQPKRVALLAYLAVASPNGFYRRDKLLALFWPESDQEHGRAALRKALYFLRQSLGDDVVVNRGDEEVGLAEGAIWCDAAVFQQALHAGELEEAVDLHDGPLLDGFHLAEADQFERWLESERQRLADRYAAALESLAERAESAADHKAALEWWRRLAAHDPYNTPAALRLAEALATAGDRANALQYAEEHERRLREELDMEPDEEVLALVKRLKHERGRAGQTTEGEPVREAQESVAEARPLEEEPVEPSRVPLSRVLGTYALVSFGGLVAVHIFTVQLGLPDWFFRSAVVLLVVSLPAVIVTTLLAGKPAAKGRVSWRKTIGFFVLAFALIGLSVSGYMAMRVMGIGPWGSLIGKGVLQERDMIVLADFENRTGDPRMARMVTDLVRLDLEQSPVVRIANSAYVHRVLQRMMRESHEPLDAELAREVAIREGLKAVVSGEISEAGSSYLLVARLVTAETGEELECCRETAADRDAIISSIDKLTSSLRERIGESLRTIRGSRPLRDVRTASLEALRLYHEGVEANIGGDFTRACELANRAIEIDTLFVAAYRLRSYCLGNQGIARAQVIADVVRAYELRHRLTLREQYNSEGRYHQVVTGDWEAMIHAWRMVLEIEPSWATAYNQIGLAYRRLRDFARAEEVLRRRIEMQPSAAVSWRVLARTLFDQGKFAETEETLRRWQETLPDDPGILWYRALFASALGENDAAEQHVRALKDRQRASSYWQRTTSEFLGRLALVQGELSVAESWFRDAMAIYHEQALAPRFLLVAVESAYLRLWVLGDTVGALETVAAALETHPFNSIEPLERPYAQLAGFYALAGQPGRARSLLMDWEAIVPLVHRRTQEADRRLGWGTVWLTEGRGEDALEELRFVHDRAECTICQLPLLGRAYEALGQSDSALAMYERYLTIPYHSRVIDLDSPFAGGGAFWIPVVNERLGELYEQRGDTAKAVHYYSKLVDLWKGADRDLQPRVEAASQAIRTLSGDT